MTDPHPIVRAAERYGLTLTSDDLRDMMLAITAAKLRLPSTAVLQRIQRDHSELWFVDAGDQRVRVAYSAMSARILSVLPMNDDGLFVKRRGSGKTQSTRGRPRRERAVVEVWE